jgi:hypothetical protein
MIVWRWQHQGHSVESGFPSHELIARTSLTILATSELRLGHYGEVSVLSTTKLGVARRTNRLEDVVRFYRDGLGLVELHRIGDHSRIVSVILGLPSVPYYLKFTDAHEHLVGKVPTTENVLVICLPNESEWTNAVARMEKSGYEAVVSSNPFGINMN